jgi:hypothetical protein
MDAWGGLKEGKIPNRNGQLLSQPNINMAQLQLRRLLLAGFFLDVLFNLKMAVIYSSETLGFLQPAWHYNSEDRTLHTHQCEVLKSSDAILCCGAFSDAIRHLYRVSRNSKSVIRNKLRAFLEIDHIYTSEVTFTQNFFKIQQLVRELKGGCPRVLAPLTHKKITDKIYTAVVTFHNKPLNLKVACYSSFTRIQPLVMALVIFCLNAQIYARFPCQNVWL